MTKVTVNFERERKEIARRTKEGYHPHRCETCKFKPLFRWKDRKDCPLYKKLTKKRKMGTCDVSTAFRYAEHIFDDVGCASWEERISWEETG